MRKSGKRILLLLALAAAFLTGLWSGDRGNGAGAARKALYWVDPMHPAYKSDKPGVAPDCGMQLEPVYAAGAATAAGGKPEDLHLPFGTVNVSPQRQQLIGVRVAPVERAPASRVVRLLGRVVPDEMKVYRVTAGTDGWIMRVAPVTTGSIVAEHDLLATFYSFELMTGVQAYVNSVETLKQYGRGNRDASKQARFVAGNSGNYRNSLRNLGMSEHQLDELDQTRQAPDDIEIRSPARGLVLTRNVSNEQRFQKGTELYQIADLSRVWVLGDLFGADAQAAKAGLPVKVTLPDQGKTFQGRVSRVKPVFDGTTRTLKLRIEVDNPGYVLRPDMFVDVEIPVESRSALAVPGDAILDSGLRKIVFVDRGNGYFEPRRVETGARFGDRVEILRGLMAGERVVVSGNFLLDSESRMRMAAAGVAGANAECVVCGMPIDEAKMRAAGRSSRYRGKTYVFCTEQCKHEFDAAPERHAWAGGPAPDAASAPAPQGAPARKAPMASPSPGGPMPEGEHGHGHD